MEKINKDLLKHIAELARLNLTEKEVEEFLPQLKEILDAFSKLDEVKVDKVKASFQPIELKNVYREDKPSIPLSQDEALLNAKHKKDGYFKGPKAI